MTALLRGGGVLLAIIALLWYLYGRVWDAATEACNAQHRETALKESIRQKDDAGKLKTGEVKNEGKVRESIVIIKQAPDPSGCGKVNAPADTLRELGGVQDKPAGDARTDRR